MNVPKDLKLKGTLPSGSGVMLCLEQITIDGVKEDEPRLVLRGQDDEPRVDVLKTLRYAVGRVSDSLFVDDREYGVPTGKADAAMALIRHARLPAPRALDTTRYVEPLRDAERRFLAQVLSEDERLLCFLHTSSGWKVEGVMSGEAPLRLAVTSTRQILLAVNEVGDTFLSELPRAALDVREERGRDRVLAGDHAFFTTRQNERRFHEIAKWSGRHEPQRTLRAAIATLSSNRELAFHWLDAIREESGAARLTLAALRNQPWPTGDLLAEDAIVPWFIELGLSTEKGRSLIEGYPPSDATAALATHLFPLTQKGKSEEDAIEDAIAYATLLAKTGDAHQALSILEARYAELPPAALLELVPHPEGVSKPRVRLLERIAELRGDQDTRRALARLEPLRPERMDAVQGPRAAAISSLLRDVDATPDTTPRRALPITTDERANVLRHPLTRSGGVMGKLTELIADAELPDFSALRSYCETLKDERALRAFDEAKSLLGLEGDVSCFVSRGDRSVGARAYEASPSFLLLGAEHLDGALALSEAELRFTLGAELAHLLYGHARLTSKDVSRGAYDKGKATVETVLGLLPMVGALAKMERLGKVVDLAGKAMSALGHAEKVADVIRSDDDESVPVSLGGGGELIAAHRVMQMTADRAGLVCSGSLKSAVTAILKTEPRYHDVQKIARDRGLVSAITRRDEHGALLLPDLAVRISALFAFLLSDDYAALEANGQADE